MADTLSHQARVVACSFLVAVALACTLAFERPLFEAWIKEGYRPPTPELQALVTELSRSDLAVKTVARLEPDRREALYDLWMQLDRPDPALAARMVSADTELFLGRAERTLIVGSAAQRSRALSFLVQSRSELAPPALRRAHGWFDRTRNSGSRDAVARALSELETATTRRRP